MRPDLFDELVSARRAGRRTYRMAEDDYSDSSGADSIWLDGPDTAEHRLYYAARGRDSVHNTLPSVY